MRLTRAAAKVFAPVAVMLGAACTSTALLFAPCLVLLAAACTSTAPAAPPALPVLAEVAAKVVQEPPRPEDQRDDLDSQGQFEMPTYRRQELPESQRPAPGPGFADDAAAIAAARTWLAERHPMPADAIAADLRFGPYDRERNRIEWQQYFGDVPVGSGGSVQFVATTAVSSAGEPVTLAPVADSEQPLLGGDAALAAWRQIAKNRGIELEQLAAREEVTLLAAPRLQFVKSSLEHANPHGTTVWRPAWLLDESGTFGFDALAGTAWHETDSNELSTKPLEAWSLAAELVGPPMSLVRLLPLPPTADAAQFREEQPGQYDYPKDAQAPATAAEAPFASDGEAIAAAKQWVERHFALPDGTVLAADSGSQQPAVRATGQGHNVMLRASLQGVLTDCYTTVCFEGRRVSRAYVAMFGWQTIAGSTKPTLTKQGAINALLCELADEGAAPDVVDRVLQTMQPRLEYVRSPMADLDCMTLAPNWSMSPNGTVFVDAFTGVVWRNG